VILEVEPRFDHVLLDTGAGISDVVLYTVSLAGEILVVVTPEPTSLTDAYATMKVLATTQGRRKFNLLVNQTRKLGEGRAVRQQLQQVVDRYVNPGLDSPVRLELLGEVPSDSAVRDSVLRRQLLLELQPGAPASVAIGNIATKIVGA
jgi:flagellar biosynthesis protein FlhG